MLKKFGTTVVLAFMFTILLLLQWNNLFYFNQRHFPFALTFPIRMLLGFAFFVAATLVLLVLRWLNDKFIKKLTGRRFVIGLLIGSFLIRLLWVLYANTPPVKDFYTMYTAALSASVGDFSFMETVQYFILYPYQVGFVLYQSLIISIFGEHIIALKIVNCLLSTFNVWMVYLLTKRIFSEKSARISAIFFSIYIPNIVMSSVLTNQIIALSLFLGAIYLFLYKNNLLIGLLIGLLLSIGNLMRPLSLIIIIAMFLYTLFFAPSKSKYPLARHLVKFFIALLVFIGNNHGIDHMLMEHNVTQSSIQTLNPYWKFAVGLNHDTIGTWNIEDHRFVARGETPEQRNEYAKQLIRERLADPVAVLRLMYQKFQLMWSDVDTALSWSTNNTDIPQFVTLILIGLQRAMYMAIGWLMLVGLYKQRKTAPKELFFVLIFIIGFVLVHQLIEIQTRYRYCIMPFFFILGAGALEKSLSLPNLNFGLPKLKK